MSHNLVKAALFGEVVVVGGGGGLRALWLPGVLTLLIVSTNVHIQHALAIRTESLRSLPNPNLAALF
jgi:predicted patatin/cPLA2 family phospholipase